MHRSRKINAGFILASHPDITWAVKMCPMYMRNPHKEFTFTTTYPSLIVNDEVVGEVDTSHSFRLSCRGVPQTNCSIVRARDDALAIWRECHRPDQRPVYGKWACRRLSRRGVPHTNCSIVRA